MTEAHIGSINELIGPLFGPNMHALIKLMREEHDYTGRPIPSVFAAYVQNVCLVYGTHGNEPSAEQCPERFAAQALNIMGKAVDSGDIDAASHEFQQRLRFHLQR